SLVAEDRHAPDPFLRLHDHHAGPGLHHAALRPQPVRDGRAHTNAHRCHRQAGVPVRDRNGAGVGPHRLRPLALHVHPGELGHGRSAPPLLSSRTPSHGEANSTPRSAAASLNPNLLRRILRASWTSENIHECSSTPDFIAIIYSELLPRYLSVSFASAR